MLNLAIECSGVAGSVALAERDRISAVLTLPEETASVQSLTPSIRALLESSLAGGAVPDLISLTCGPGSFTGLRVGLTTAKMLAWAWQSPIAALDTLHVIAHASAIALRATENAAGNPPQRRLIVPVLNAFRRQVFVAAWEATTAGELLPVAESQVIDAGLWQKTPLGFLADSRFGACEAVVSGPGLDIYPPVKDAAVQVADPTVWHPKAADVAVLGWHAFQAGRAISPAQLLPNYVRASAAEEKLRTASG